jgi:hypothetical protein
MGNFGATIGAVVAFVIGVSQGANDPMDLMMWSALGGGIGAVALGSLGSREEQEEREDHRDSD